MKVRFFRLQLVAAALPLAGCSLTSDHFAELASCSFSRTRRLGAQRAA
jgi:hypothetical protein